MFAGGPQSGECPIRFAILRPSTRASRPARCAPPDAEPRHSTPLAVWSRYDSTRSIGQPLGIGGGAPKRAQPGRSGFEGHRPPDLATGFASAGEARVHHGTMQWKETAERIRADRDRRCRLVGKRRSPCDERRMGNARIRGVPRGSRTPVAAVKGRCPGPLDDGDGFFSCIRGGPSALRPPSGLVEPGGIEPPTSTMPL